jgi:hypothetical protein
MVEYVAMATANLSWLAWRQKRPAEAESLGKEALQLWHGMEDPYGVDWQAILPLVAVAVEDRRFEQAVECIRGLFGENQHPLPQALTTAVKEVIAIAEDSDAAAVESKLQQVIEVSREIGYL